MELCQSLLAAFILIAIPTFATAGPFDRKETVNLSFDEFCDGMQLTVKGQIVTGVRTGCSSDVVSGVAGSLSKDGASVVVHIGSFDGGSFLYVIDDTPKRWTVTTPDGFVLNSGTYSLGSPPPLLRVGDALKPTHQP